MSAKGGRRAILCALTLCAATYAMADDDESADMEFIEYLGLWEESDEDWLLLDENALANNEKRSDPVPEGEESTELEDES